MEWKGGTLVSLFLCIFIISVNARKEIPSFLHLCKRTDPDMDGCIKNSIEDLRPQLASGVPNMKIPAIEPLYLKEMVVAEGKGMKIVTNDIYVVGCSNFNIDYLKSDIDKGQFDFEVSFPRLELTAKYTVDAKILMIPIKGDGDAIGQVENAKAKATLFSEIRDEGDERHIRWTNMDIDIIVNGGKMQLNNLFGGEKVLGEVVNAAINLNFQHFFHELKPLFEQAIKEFILNSANSIVEGFDYNEIFPN